MFSRLIAGAVALLLTPTMASAATILFDFESTPATFISPPAGLRPGALSALSLTEGGLTLSLYRENQGRFDIVENAGNQAGKPASFGDRSLDPFFQETVATAFIGNFSEGIFGVSIDFGDYGGDADSFTLEAYSGLDGTGGLLDSISVNYGGNTFPTFMTASLGGPFPARSIRFIGGSAGSFPNSLFYDNITAVTQAPEPATLWLLGTAAGLVAARRRRRQA